MSVIAARAAAAEPEPHAGLAALFGGDLSWQDRALCARTDPEAFFPDRGGSAQAAKRICRSCPVREQCLEYALENDERFGIWGGLSASERMAASLDRKPRPVPAAAPSEPARSRPGRKAVEPEQPKPEVAQITDAHIEDRLGEIPELAGAAPETAVPARRCRKCKYMTNTISHQVMCGDGK